MNEIKKIIGIDEYDKLENVCFVNPINEEELLDDVEYLFDQLDSHYDLSKGEDYFLALNHVSNIEVLTQDKFKIDAERIIWILQDFADDNYSYHYFNREIEGEEIIKKFVEDFNSAQTGYIGGDHIANLDVSEEFRQFVKGLEGEVGNE